MDRCPLLIPPGLRRAGRVSDPGALHQASHRPRQAAAYHQLRWPCPGAPLDLQLFGEGRASPACSAEDQGGTRLDEGSGSVGVAARPKLLPGAGGIRSSGTPGVCGSSAPAIRIWSPPRKGAARSLYRLQRGHITYRL